MRVNKLSQAIRGLRKRHGLSLSQMARLVGTSPATLSRYESSWERFEIYTLKKIAVSLGYSLDIEFKELKTLSRPKTLSQVVNRLQRLFWDRKLKKSDFRRYPVWITERVIEYGSLEDVYALTDIMGRRAFLNHVSKCRFQSPKTEKFWREILKREGVRCTKRSFPRGVESS